MSDLDGEGEAVSGIVIMRQGENALEVIGRVTEKLRQIEPDLPEGVKIVPVYDPSELILHSIGMLKSTVVEVVLTAVKTLIVTLAVPLSAIGAVWFLYLLGYNLSVGV